MTCIFRRTARSSDGDALARSLPSKRMEPLVGLSSWSARRRLKQAARQSVLAARLEGAPRRQTGQVWRLALDGQELGTPGLVQSRHGAQEPERVGMAWI